MVIITRQIDGFTVVVGFGTRTVDPMASLRKAHESLEVYDDLETALRENAVYSELKEGEYDKPLEYSAPLHQKFNSISTFQKLCLDGSLVTDLRGVKYFIKDLKGRWDEHTVTRLGEEIPEGFTSHMTAEMHSENELANYKMLLPAAKLEYLDRLLCSADRQSYIAHSLNPSLDRLAWLEDEKNRILNRYREED